MKVRALDPITVASGQTLEFKPGGNHIMLTGLVRPLKEGQVFPPILTFEKAGAAQVMVKVERAGALNMSPGGMCGMQMPHDHVGQ